MRRRFIVPLVLAISVLLAGVAVASSQGSSQSRRRPDPRQTEPTPEQKADFHKNREEFQKAKKKVGDEVMLVGVWKNCKFHILRLPAERYTAVHDGQFTESVEVAPGVKTADEAEKQLPARDPACDNVHPTREQIDANRAEIEAEEAKLNPGRPVRPGG